MAASRQVQVHVSSGVVAHNSHGLVSSWTVRHGTGKISSSKAGLCSIQTMRTAMRADVGESRLS